jgi:hypothetical protein
MPEHANVHAALCGAQAEFAPAVKASKNPAFKSMYADLQSCIEAVGPALNRHGIAYFWDAVQGDNGQWVVECHLVHAATTTAITCAWPVIIDKANAQGFASGSTYARRYSLMAVTGLAPEDDDGNAASQSPAKPSVPPQVAQARAQANALVARAREALEHGEDAWLLNHVLTLTPAVRNELAVQLTPAQIGYLRTLKERDSMTNASPLRDTPERMSQDEIPNGGLPE